jgi:hypothetical protein
MEISERPPHFWHQTILGHLGLTSLAPKGIGSGCREWVYLKVHTSRYVKWGADREYGHVQRILNSLVFLATSDDHVPVAGLIALGSIMVEGRTVLPLPPAGKPHMYCGNKTPDIQLEESKERHSPPVPAAFIRTGASYPTQIQPAPKDDNVFAAS